LWILLVSHANQQNRLSMANQIAIPSVGPACVRPRRPGGRCKDAAIVTKPLPGLQLLPNVYQDIRRLRTAALHALGRRGVSRADNRCDNRGSGELVCLEITTQAGVTGTSLMPELAAYAGITFDELVQWMVADASTRR
jgi:hypothetical protein